MCVAYMRLASVAAASHELLWVLKPKLHVAWIQNSRVRTFDSVFYVYLCQLRLYRSWFISASWTDTFLNPVGKDSDDKFVLGIAPQSVTTLLAL